jgi:phosphate-selective porin O/P
MRRMWGGILLLVAFTVIASPAYGDEVADLKRMVQDLQTQVTDLQQERALETTSVDQAVEEYLTRRAAGETAGEMAGYVDGKFMLQSAEGDFSLRIGGGATANLQLNEPGGMQDNTFKLALVRLAISGQLGDGWFFMIQPEFSTWGVNLRDAWIKTSLLHLLGGTGSEYIDAIDMKAGQFKMPFSLAALASPYAWDLSTLPMIVRALAPGWDVGLQISNTLHDGMLYWALAVSNGTNAVNDSDEFWYWARVVVAPFLSGDDDMIRNMHFGANFGTSHESSMSGGTPNLSTSAGGPYGMVGESDSGAMYGAFNENYPVMGRGSASGPSRPRVSGPSRKSMLPTRTAAPAARTTAIRAS